MDNEKIGAFIAERRKTLGLKQRELAEKLNVTDKAVSKWERGLSLPDIALLPDLSEALGVTITELLSGEKEAARQSELMGETAAAIAEYAGNEVRRKAKNIGTVIAAILTAACIIGISVCMICDTAVTGRLTWSLIPISSIVYGWLVIMPAVTAKNTKIKLVLSLASVSVFTLPFLGVLDILIKESDIIFSLGSLTAVTAVIWAWLSLIMFIKLRKRLAAAGMLLSAVPVQIIINCIVMSFVGGQLIDGWDIAVCVVFVCMAVILTFDDIFRKK